MKNKEIEELLNELKRRNERYYYCKNNDISFSDEDYKSYLLLSYIEQLEEEIIEYEFLINMQNSREYRSKFLKEFQKEHGKNVFPDYDEIYKRYDEMKVELQDANVSVIWWQNRYNAVERDRKQLENNRDKAIEFIEEKRKVFEWYDTDLFYLESLLKGDSDE